LLALDHREPLPVAGVLQRLYENRAAALRHGPGQRLEGFPGFELAGLVVVFVDSHGDTRLGGRQCAQRFVHRGDRIDDRRERAFLRRRACGQRKQYAGGTGKQERAHVRKPRKLPFESIIFGNF
jgi:hypothetical protein